MGGNSLPYRKLVTATASLFALVLFAGAAQAQQAVFTGKITSAAGQPLGGASVGIPTLGVGSIADVNGNFTFTVDVGGRAGRQVDVIARYIGYKPKQLPVTLTAGRVQHDFVLDKDVLNLEEVVVTGTSEAVSQKKTAFSVGVVDNTQIKDAPAVTPLGSLEGKIPGVSVQTQSGQPGGEPAIRLRSATSLTGRTDPLIIIDGVISNLGLADVNSEDIERIEVIKGAAASSLYGSNAANGVVQIFTKRGGNLAEGQTSFTFRNEYGQSDLPKKVEGNMSHDYQVDANGQFLLNANGDRVEKNDKISDLAYPVYYPQLDVVFKGGSFLTNYASVGQRRGNTNFNASFQNTHETGVVVNLKGFQRENFRINVDQALTDRVDLGMGAFYGRSTADQGESAFPFFGLRFLEPNVKLDSVIDANGTYNPKVQQPPLSGNVVNPLYQTQQYKVSNDRDRFTGTFRSQYRILDWMTFDGNVGYDEANRAYKAFTPLNYENSQGSPSSGGLTQQSDNNRSYNINTSLSATRQWREVRNTSKVAFVYEDQTNQSLAVTASALTVPKVPEFASAAQDPNSPIQPTSKTETIRNKNAFLVSSFDIKDRYIVDGLIRQDQSSLFGANERTAVYHRVSGAYRLSEDFSIPGVDEFKIRASHGTAGLRPQFDAQYEVFQVVSGSPQKVTLGNKDLKPAFSRETELGFNLNFLQNYTLEYTYAKRRTSDQIMQVPLSASTGYQNQWRNAATLDGHSHEVALGAVLLSKADYFWRVGVTGDRARSTIADLKVPAFFIGPDGTTAMFHIGKGEPLGVIYGDDWIKTAAQLDETIKAGKLPGTAADYQLNEEGFYVAKSAYHTLGETPLKAWSCTDAACTSSTSVVRIGDANPDFTMGFTTNAQWKGLNLNGVLTWNKGGNVYNMTRQWPFNEQRDPVFDQRNKPAATCPANWDPTVDDPTCPFSTGRKPVTYYQTFYNGITPNSYFVEDGSYMRLRELALSYNIPERYVSRIPVGGFRTARLGIVGRNLWTQTNYSGYNPDVSGVTDSNGGNPFVYRVDYFTYPAYRTFSMMLELGF
ncbi:MAG TPA: SusC/RagA family TonB-linked outer membrane protein [Gemmatimonadaceae bacterium]|nr:SusC/RagA family TonB-linked outer membrane protein [Gemmatimonadaceae bacterium]